MKRLSKPLAIAGIAVILAAGAAWYFLARSPANTAGAPPPGTGAAPAPPAAGPRGAQRQRGPASNRVVVAKVEVQTIGDRIAAIGAAYRSRHHPRSWTASYKADRWSGIPTKALPPMPVRVGALGGGFTLFSRAALEQCPVLGPSIDAAGKNLGWDGWLCARFAQAKWKVMLHAGVRCEHLV